jgi:hypothetical protein
VNPVKQFRNQQTEEPSRYDNKQKANLVNPCSLLFIQRLQQAPATLLFSLPVSYHVITHRPMPNGRSGKNKRNPHRSVPSAACRDSACRHYSSSHTGTSAGSELASADPPCPHLTMPKARKRARTATPAFWCESNAQSLMGKNANLHVSG